MKNKKGFTLIELIVSVVLVSVVMISLLSSLVQLRRTYTTIHENSDILVYSSSIARVINNDLTKNNGIRSITCASDGKSCDMILGNNDKRKIELLENITEDTNYPSEKGKHDNIKTTIKYTNPKIEHDNIIYIRTLELDKYVNKNNDVSTKGYSFLDMTANKTEYYNGSNEDFIDIYTTLKIRVNNGRDEDVESNNILLHAAGRYDFSEYIGKVYSIYLDPNGAKENVTLSYLDEMFGVGFFAPDTVHDISSNHLRKLDPEYIPKRDGYGFAGYYYSDNVTPTEVLIIDSTGTIVANNRFFKQGVPFENIGDVTKPRVYAKWEKCEDGYELIDGVCVPKKCVVELNPGDGANTDYNSYTVSYMQKVDDLTPAQLPYKGGHLFLGYYKALTQYHNKDGTGMVQNLDYNDSTGKCISLDASWEACTAGTFLRAKKDTTCINCVKGSYNNAAGSSTCTACNDGKTTSAAGQTSCNEDCSNKAHAKTWETNTWNSDNNTVNKLCVIKTCEDGYHLSDNKCVADIYSVTLNNQSATSAGTTKVWYQYKTTKKVGNTTCYYFTDSSLTNCLNNGYTISNPSKTNYTFNGYYTDTNGGGTRYVKDSGDFTNNIYQKLPKEIKSTYTTDITLYAKWTVNDITVTFNANGGSGAPGNQKATYGSSFTLSSTRPTKANNAFVTWKDPSGGSWPAGWSTSSWSYSNGDWGISNNTLALTADWVSITKDKLVDIGNVNWNSTAFGFQIYLDYGLKKDGNTIRGQASLRGYKGNAQPGYTYTNYLNGKFTIGSKSYTFNCVELNTQATWVTFTGDFGTGSSITYKWEPNNSLSGNCHGYSNGVDQTYNTWTSSKTGTISF